MILIDQIFSREILDSRGRPTLETRVLLSDRSQGVVSVPSGVSRSAHEATELRDKDFGRYFGLGVQHAVRNVNEVIAPRLRKENPLEQNKVDKIMLELDQTPNQAHLGANAILSVSLAVAKAAARLTKKKLYQYLNDLFIRQESLNWYEEKIALPPELQSLRLPIPVFNLVEGGLHSDSGLPFQEYWLIPLSVKGVAEQVRAGAEIYHELGEVLRHKGLARCVGDEGGYAPSLTDFNQPLELLKEAIARTKLRLGHDIYLGLDIAANSFRAAGGYKLDIEGFDGSASSLAAIYKQMLARFPIFALEDPFAEEDWEAFAALTAEFGQRLNVVGDDLISTNRGRLLTAVDKKAINAVIIKPNQIGTLSGTLDVIKLAKAAGYLIIISHRGGETVDDFIVDLAVGAGAQLLKAGAPARGERVAKYNRLLKVAEEIE